MKIKVLGTRANVEISKPWHSKHSGVLIDGVMLFDLGEREFLEYNPGVLFITHLHPDHAFFIKEKKKVNLDIPVYVPEKSDYLENARVIGDKVKCGKYTIQAVPVIHSLKVKSLAYLVMGSGKKIFYSGDMVWIEKKYHRMLHDLDLVILEASTFRKNGLIRRQKDTGKIFGHAGLPGLVNLFKPFANQFIIMHFGAWFLRDVAAGRRRIMSLGGEGFMLEAAHDGKEFVI